MQLMRDLRTPGQTDAKAPAKTKGRAHARPFVGFRGVPYYWGSITVRLSQSTLSQLNAFSVPSNSLA